MHQRKFPSLSDEIEKAYELVYNKKVLPSMRSLQFAGKPIELNNARIFNCSFLPIVDWRAFSEIMFLLLSGCGVGYSVQNHHVEKLPEIKIPIKTKRYLIGDSIEGWADAIRMLTKAYFNGISPSFNTISYKISFCLNWNFYFRQFFNMVILNTISNSATR
jgi:ribonucleoside-diphosphate reductase alpha chain